MRDTTVRTVLMESMSYSLYQQWLKAYSHITPDVEIHNRQLQTLRGWHAAGLGLPLMIIWLLHNRALQLSRAQTLKWQQPPPPPPPAAALISSWAPRAAGLPACCAIWHTEPLTPSLHKSRETAATYFQWIITVSTTDACSDIPHLLALIFRHPSRLLVQLENTDILLGGPRIRDVA